MNQRWYPWLQHIRAKKHFQLHKVIAKLGGHIPCSPLVLSASQHLAQFHLGCQHKTVESCICTLVYWKTERVGTEGRANLPRIQTCSCAMLIHDSKRSYLKITANSRFALDAVLRCHLVFVMKSTCSAFTLPRGWWAPQGSPFFCS